MFIPIPREADIDRKKVHPGRYIPASLRATVKGIVFTAIFKLTIKLTPAILLPLILTMLL